VTWVRSSL